MNRREFLKIFAGVTAGAVLTALPIEIAGDPQNGSKVSDIPLRTRDNEMASEAPWTREQMLTDTRGFFDAILAKIEKWDVLYPGLTKSESIKSFYSSFSTKVDQKTTSQSKERVAWTDIFYEGYQRYGERVSKLSNRVATLVPQIGSPIIDVGLFQSLSLWWETLEELNNMFFRNDMDEVTISLFSFDKLDVLFTLQSWFQSLKKGDSYKLQREAYKKDGQDTIDSNGLIKNIEDDWDKRFVGVITPENKAAYDARKKIYLNIIGAVRDIFPTALVWINSIETDSTSRSHFQDGTIYLDNTFTLAMEALEKYLIEGDSKDKLGYGALARRKIDLFVYVMMHELGHKFDVSRVGLQAWGTHPQDELDFIEQRIKTLEEAEVLYRGDPATKEAPLTFGEIQALLIDPIYPNCFGVDQLASQDDIDSFKYECVEIIKPVIKYLETLDPTERERLFKAAQIEDFVAGEWTMLDIFKVTLLVPNSDKFNNSAFGQVQAKGVLELTGNKTKFHPLSSLAQLSSAVLDDMKVLAQEVQDKLSGTLSIEQGLARDQMTSMLLTHKMLYLNAIYRLLDCLYAKGQISFTIHPELFSALWSLQTDYIHQQLLHALVGPVGQYEPRIAMSSLLVPAGLQIENTKQMALNYDKFNQETFGVKVTDRFVRVINKYVDALLPNQETMARVMGADLHEPLFQYVQLAETAVGYLHLNKDIGG